MPHDPHINPLAEPGLACPECHEATEVIDRFTLGGSPGPVEHVKVICERGHWFTLPLETLAALRENQGAAEPLDAVASKRAA